MCSGPSSIAFSRLSQPQVVLLQALSCTVVRFLCLLLFGWSGSAPISLLFDAQLNHWLISGWQQLGYSFPQSWDCVPSQTQTQCKPPRGVVGTRGEPTLTTPNIRSRCLAFGPGLVRDCPGVAELTDLPPSTSCHIPLYVFLFIELVVLLSTIVTVMFKGEAGCLAVIDDNLRRLPYIKSEFSPASLFIHHLRKDIRYIVLETLCPSILDTRQSYNFHFVSSRSLHQGTQPCSLPWTANRT
jgi:hypothetical protein